MLTHRLRRWANIKLPLCRRVVLAGGRGLFRTPRRQRYCTRSALVVLVRYYCQSLFPLANLLTTFNVV